MNKSHWTTRSGSWHVGETLHVPEGPVVTFQADGEELYYLIRALKFFGVNVEFPSENLTPIY